MENKIKNLIIKKLEKNNIILDNIEYLKEDGANYLRVIIDKEGYITSKDCVEVTKIINPILDKEDLIKEAYILDVCSKERG